jgi:AraC-like DNA-binding protein
MTRLPLYLSDYPNMDSNFPFHLSVNRIDTSFPAHRHDFLEFSLVIEGKGFEIVNGESHPMKAGTFTFISPYQIHEIHAVPGQSLKLYNCTFDLSLLLGTTNVENDSHLFLVGESNLGDVPSHIQLETVEKGKFERILQEILHEYEGTEAGKALLIRAKLIEVLVWFFRLRKKGIVEESKGKLEPARLQSGVIWKVVHYVHSHYNDPLSLTLVARHFHVSSPYLSDQFKHHVGETFVNFLHEVRLRHACSLLASTELAITTIAHEVGYNSFKTFSRAFRQRKHMTPSDYRSHLSKTPLTGLQKT